MTALDRAIQDTAPARARLEEIYGRVPPVIAFIQRGDGPVAIVRALRLVGTVQRLYRESDEALTIAAVVPGEKAMWHWFLRMGAREDAPPTVEFARAVGNAHWGAYETLREPDPFRRVKLAGAAAVRAHDPFLADFERLYRGGTSYADLAKGAGMTLRQVQATLDSLRALGFEIEHRYVYGRRARA